MNFRILPVIIFFCFALIVAKVFDLALEKDNKSNGVQALAQNKAEDSPSTEKQSEHSSAAAKDDNASKDESDQATTTPQEQPTPPFQADAPKNIEISNQAPTERALLESLSKRRKELDDWANTISMKESVLNATEKKINNKMEELKKLESEVSQLLELYKAKDDEKAKRLVKIYEDMKPADAAKILDHMEMGVLLEIAGGMKEDAAAKIFAKMDPNKAKEVTVKLAEQRRLSTPKSTN